MTPEDAEISQDLYLLFTCSLLYVIILGFECIHL